MYINEVAVVKMSSKNPTVDVMTFTNFIKRPVLSTVISIFFVLLGIIGLISLPIEQYPNIAPPTISIQTFYQGADAQTVLNQLLHHWRRVSMVLRT